MCSPHLSSGHEDSGRSRWSAYRLLPLAALGVGLVLFFVSGLDEYVTFETLREHRALLLARVDDAGALAVLVFGAIYAAAVAFSIPVGAILTIAAGFLFGPAVGTITAVTAATVGATGLFIAARTAFGGALRSKAGAGLARMARGFEQDAFNYLLTLRLVPIFPFWLVNIVPAFTRIRLRTYVTATALGIVPGTLVYALVGNGLGAVFEAGGVPDVHLIFEPAILAPIVGLALLSLLPVAYRRMRGRDRNMAARAHGGCACSGADGTDGAERGPRT